MWVAWIPAYAGMTPYPLKGEGLTYIAGFDFAFDLKSPAAAPVMI